MKKIFLLMYVFTLLFVASCDGAVNTPKWAYELAEDRVRSLYTVRDVESYSPDYVSKAGNSFRVEINHQSRSVGGDYYWYTDICTVPFDAVSFYSVSCY